MFTGFISKETSINVLSDIKEEMIFLGTLIQSNDSSLIYKKSETFYIHKTQISIFEKSNGDKTLNFSYSFNPTFISWLLGLCFFPLGFLIFLIPNKEKDDFEFFINSFKF